MGTANTWDCCRTCLSMESLHAIFANPELCEKYTNLLEIVAGVKIEINDTLPQLICSNCIEFVNQSKRFRKRCEDAFKLLTECKLDGTKLIQLQMFKREDTATQLDITEQSDEDFKDYDDNVTLDTLQNNLEDDKCEIAEAVSKEFVKQAESTDLTTTRGKKKTVGVKPERLKQEKEPKRKRVTKKEKSGEEKEKIECEYCHKVLTSKLSLRNHYKIHTGFDVVCEHCGKKFITRRLLLMHCRAKHGYEKTDKCSYCDYRASNAEQVKIHERLHTGEKPFVCEECGSGFHRKSSYLQHVAIHLPEKTVQCVQCPALFKSLTLMRIHLQRHRAPRYLFRCGACSATFARRRNVARHLQRVHSLPPDQGNIERLHLH